MTILIVDDNEEHLYLLQALLSGNGYQVVTAVNGAEALAKARQAPPDLIVSDILMPVMDGFALCREWKKDERLRHIPFVFYTGTCTDKRDREFALGLGAEQFIVKPEEPAAFLRAIREVIERVQRPPAPPARVPIEAPRQDEEGYLKQYNEALIRKLEAKTEQLAQANRQLESNIAKRKLAENVLRDSEARYRRLFESAQDGILILDAETGMVTDVNPFLVELLSFSHDQFLNEAVWDLGFFKDVWANQAKFMELQQKGYVRYENLPLETAGGRKINVEFVSNVYAVDHRKVIQCNIRDITERKRVEQAQRESERKYQELVENANCIILHWSRDGRIIFLNEFGQRFFGYTEAEIRGRHVIGTIVPETETGGRDLSPLMDQICANPAAFEQNVNENVRRNGERVWIAWTNKVALDPQGQVAEILSIGTDITARKRAEAEILHAKEEWERTFDAVPDLIVLIDVNHRIIRANRAMAARMGSTPEQLVGQPSYEAVHGLSAPADICPHSKLLASGKEQRAEIAEERLHGTFDVSVTPLLDATGHLVGSVHVARDITERKRVEEELRVSQQIIEGVLNAIPVRVFWKDKNLVYLGCNEVFARDAGFASSKDIIGKDDFQMGWRDQAELYRSDDREVIESGRSKLLIEEPQTTPEGKTITLLSNKLPLRSSTGEITGLLGTYMDITDRKLAENKLRDSEMRYRRLFEAAKDGVLLLDAETGMVTDVNPYLIELLSFSHEQFLNKAVWDLGFFKDVWANQAKFRELQKTGFVRYDDLPLETADGRKINVEFVSNVYAVDHRDVIQCNVRDITERKHAQAAIREQEEELRTILKTTMEGVFMFDMQGRFLEVNDAYCSMIGYSRDELLRMSIPDVEADEKPAEVAATVQRIMKEGKAQFERRQRRKDGTLVNLDVSCNFISTSSGRFVCFLRDITERKRREAERIALDQQLRQAQKMESVGQLAGGVAHDFNNILTGISGYTELALERLETASPMREDLAEVLRLSKRAAELTRQLLAFSRRQTLQPQILNINDMIADTSKMLKRVLGENIDLQFTPAPDLGNVRADPAQMEQVLMNLAINARDAMPSGGKLTIETANVELDAEYAVSHVSVVPGRYVMMAVSDTGHGMDAATQSHLFEPFFTTKEKGKGTGLGLATAYGIVKQHGGNIWVYTEPGSGATFKVYLPQVEEAAGAMKPAAEPAIPRGQETILIVEDEPAVRAVAERALKARGYALLTASNAEEAEGLFSAHAERISLLLTDVVLPGINGPNLYDRLRIAHPGLKVLYMSGHTGNATVHHGVLGAGVAFMQKPFTLEMIARKVRQVLDG